MVYVGISPIYRWYIAYIPMVYRPYTNSPPQPEKTTHDPFTSYSRSLHVAPQAKDIHVPPTDKKHYKIIIFLNLPPLHARTLINNVYFCTLILFERHLHERNKLYTNQT